VRLPINPVNLKPNKMKTYNLNGQELLVVLKVTDEASDLVTHNNTLHHITDFAFRKEEIESVFAYLCSPDEEKKEGDKIIHRGQILTVGKNRGNYLSVYEFTHIDIRTDSCIKILYTNNPALIKDGVKPLPEKCIVECTPVNPNAEPINSKGKVEVEAPFLPQFVMWYNKDNQKQSTEKNLDYWKKNAEEDYMLVPISVLRYISELEQSQSTEVKGVDVEKLAENYANENYDAPDYKQVSMETYQDAYNQALQSHQLQSGYSLEDMKRAIAWGRGFEISKVNPKDIDYETKQFLQSLPSPTPKAE
jgi:hypothetical protein